MVRLDDAEVPRIVDRRKRNAERGAGLAVALDHGCEVDVREDVMPGAVILEAGECRMLAKDIRRLLISEALAPAHAPRPVHGGCGVALIASARKRAYGPTEKTVRLGSGRER